MEDGHTRETVVWIEICFHLLALEEEVELARHGHVRLSRDGRAVGAAARSDHALPSAVERFDDACVRSEPLALQNHLICVHLAIFRARGQGELVHVQALELAKFRPRQTLLLLPAKDALDCRRSSRVFTRHIFGSSLPPR